MVVMGVVLYIKVFECDGLGLLVLIVLRTLPTQWQSLLPSGRV